jgi:hypothetical protein
VNWPLTSLTDISQLDWLDPGLRDCVFEYDAFFMPVTYHFAN